MDKITAVKEAGAQGIADQLAIAIHEHRLAPGAKLSEDEVGEVFGVSRTVVRAALQILAHDKMVDLKRNRGAFVAQPSVKEVLLRACSPLWRHP